MPKFLEDKLRAEYGNNKHAIYGTMNKIGAMHGNKETAKGREMERKHENDMKKPKYHSTTITHHHDGSHTVEHHPHMKAGKSGAFMERGESKSYSAEDGHSMVAKLSQNLGIESPETEEAEGSDNMKADHEGEDL